MDAEDLKEIAADFIIEAGELIEELDQDLVALENDTKNKELINKIFRCIHTIKGNAEFLKADKNFGKIAQLSHATEDVMGVLRTDTLVLSIEIMNTILISVDMIKLIFGDAQNNKQCSIDPSPIVVKLRSFLSSTRPKTQRLEKISVVSKEEALVEEIIKPEETPSSSELSLADDDMQEIIDDFLVESGEQLEQIEQDLVAFETTPDDSLIGNIFRNLHTIKGNANFFAHDPNFAKLGSLAHAMEDCLGAIQDKKISLAGVVMDCVLISTDVLRKIYQDIKAKIPTSAKVENLISQLRNFAEGKISEQDVSSQRIEVEQEDISEGAAVSRTHRFVHGEQTIRVATDRLNNLMNLAGELVLGRNRLQQIVRNFEEILGDDRGSRSLKSQEKSDLLQKSYLDLVSAVDFINFVTSDIQMAVLKTRMQPVGKIFNRFNRTVRDLARELGKQVSLVIHGAETELDKSVIDVIGDPLLHLLRNSVDHGIELPDVREKNDKHPVGIINISAFHEGNYIIICLSDDGKGIDPQIIKDKAINMGIITKVDADRLPKSEILKLIFSPGFSTAQQVTSYSGRGVGMDVVKNNIERLNGSVDIRSQIGQGTTFTIRLPLTLAIIQALQVKAGTENFAIPLASVIETVRIHAQQIETVSGYEVIRFRKTIIPILRLDTLFEIEEQEKETSNRIYIVIAGIADKKVGIVVDKILGQQEIVVKSMGHILENTPGIAGACITGNGRVMLIIDISSLFRLLPFHLTAFTSTKRIADRSIKNEILQRGQKVNILIVEDARSERKRIRLALEARGFKVVEAIDGKDALAKLMDYQIHLVITDIEMPGLDGYQLTAKIRKNRKHRNIPVVAVSSHKEMIDRIKGMEAGIDTYLPKPFNEQDLMNAINTLLY